MKRLGIAAALLLAACGGDNAETTYVFDSGKAADMLTLEGRDDLLPLVDESREICEQESGDAYDLFLRMAEGSPGVLYVQAYGCEARYEDAAERLELPAAPLP